MALSVDYVYQFILKIIRKNQAGGLSSLEFQYFWNGEQSAYHTDLLGRFQRINNGKEGANTGLIENQTIGTKLSPFITPVTLPIVAGVANKPGDFCYELALRIGDEIVVHLTHDQLSSAKTSVIDPPSIADGMYYCVEYLGYYSFLPTTVTSADLDYIASPVNVVWGKTFDGDGREVYDPTTSIQPQWLNADAMEISKRVLKTLGVSFSSQDFENYGDSVIKTGD